MSFHGGLVGVLVALAMFANRRGKRIADVFDFAAPLPAIGFGAGRLGNFINGELWASRPTYRGGDRRWRAAARVPAVRGIAGGPRVVPDPLVVHGETAATLAPSGLFLVCYGVFRFAVEFVRVRTTTAATCCSTG